MNILALLRTAVLTLLLGATSVQADYDKLESYGDTLCNLIIEYVKTNAAASSSDVVNFVNSVSAQTVFIDGQTSGYSRDQVLFEAYQVSFTINPQVEIIIAGLHDAMVSSLQQKQKFTDAAQYGAFANMGLTAATLLGLSRFAWIYFRVDRRVIDHYRQNSHRYTIGNGPSLFNTVNPNINTPLVVPEPTF